MNRFAMAILKCDAAILVYLFVRPVWWLDHRWHWNQYRQARAVMFVALVLYAIGSAATVMGQTIVWLQLTIAIPASILIWVYGDWLSALGRASRDYEDNPSRYTLKQMRFHYIIFPPMRLMLLMMWLPISSMSLTLALHVHSWRLWLIVAGDTWWVGVAAALYMAGVPHPPMGRAPKKERAPAFQPMPAPAA